MTAPHELHLKPVCSSKHMSVCSPLENFEKICLKIIITMIMKVEISTIHIDDDFDMSTKTIKAHSNSNYNHRMGRGGYTALREKLVNNKVLAKDEMPPRSLMWCKGRENKAGEIEDANVKLMAEKLVEHETQIKDGDVKLNPGMDAMSLVFGKDNGGFLKGVGTGVTASRYFNIPRTNGSSKEQITDLKFELRNERLELQKKDEELQALSTKVREQDKTLKLVLAHLESQGTMIPNLPSHPNESPTQVFSVDKNVESHVTPITNTIIEKAPMTDKASTNEPVTRYFVMAKSTKITVESKSATTNSHPKTKDTHSPKLP
ncbi:uncharacterized protein LOC122196626 [Lactuca sativa]|uniref:uncharacterized protein LOC122196626 n=1 Tax=Lactuca sativa TaxID=4236 RepID=UPI001C68FA7D|nr:uncharacterized protein LOC122196626 [Lactuca sativa]